MIKGSDIVDIQPIPSTSPKVGKCHISLIMMVPGAGVEPAQYFYRGILSPLRLPISPSGHYRTLLEAEGGIEPPYTALQAAA